jgi:hypothetical protein
MVPEWFDSRIVKDQPRNSQTMRKSFKSRKGRSPKRLPFDVTSVLQMISTNACFI